MSRTLLTALVSCAAVLAAQEVRAEIVVYDKDGTTLVHSGMAQGFYQLGFGDLGPGPGNAGENPAIGAFGSFGSPTVGDLADNSWQASRFRSGWAGGRFDWKASKQLAKDLKASAVTGIAYEISSHNASTATNNQLDLRTAMLSLEGSWGTFDVGRNVGLYTLGTIISTATITSAGLGLGNACGFGGDDLGCYTTGYGAKFPAFWAGFFYTTPNFDGFQVKVAALDPRTIGGTTTFQGPNPMAPPVPVSHEYARTPLPMFQARAWYDGDFGSVKVKPHVDSFVQQAGEDKSLANSKTVTAWGIGLGADVHVGEVFKIGAGGCFENGSSLYSPLNAPSTVDGVGELRKGNCFLGHARVTLGQVDLSAGAGQGNLERTDNDEAIDANFVKSQRGIHAAVQYHLYDAVHFIAEFNNLHHKWHGGNTQVVNLVNLGAAFTY